MRKGDLKKKEILQTAEQLFCRKGYEETSVQDILDVLHTSKGSFYHHYASKEMLLEAMCAQRASASAQDVAEKIDAEANIVPQLNLVLTGMMPLMGERLTFLLMLLPVFTMPEGWSVRNAYRTALSDAYAPLLTKVMMQGIAEGVLYCQRPEAVAKIVLTLANEVWCDTCERICDAETKGEKVDFSALSDALEPYRNAIEKLLSAPFGSIELMNLPDLKILADQIHLHWKNK